MRIRQGGYSAFQLLFLLFIILLLGMWSKQAFERRSFSTRVAATAIQLERWRNMVLVFYRHEGHWPQTMDDVVKAGYLPNKDFQCSTWPTNDPDSCDGSAVISMVEGGANYLTLLLPVDSLHSAAAIIKQLPGSYADETTNTVVLPVFRPNLPRYDFTSLMIKGFYNINVAIQAEVPQPACPKNWQADYDLMLNHWYNGFYQSTGGPHAGNKYPCVLGKQGVSAFRASEDINDPAYWQPRLLVALHKPFRIEGEGKGCENPLQGILTAVTFCRPPGSF